MQNIGKGVSLKDLLKRFCVFKSTYADWLHFISQGILLSMYTSD